MKLLNEILRGILIGIANIIPGVSGGTMAVSRAAELLDNV